MVTTERFLVLCDVRIFSADFGVQAVEAYDRDGRKWPGVGLRLANPTCGTNRDR
jgi:hypothetical protein